MTKVLFKILYVLVKDSSLFSLPLFRKLRNKVFSLKLGKIKDLNVGNRVTIVSAHTSVTAVINIGESFRIGDDSYIDYTGGINIGENVTVSEGVKIYTHDHNLDGDSNWRLNGIRISKLTIEDHAWIASNAIILESVRRIGRGAVVAAGSVLSKDVEDYEIYGGIPAKLIRSRNIEG